MSTTLDIETRKMPDKYWVYVWGIFALAIMVFCIPEGIVFALWSGLILSGIITFWIAGIYTLWFEASLFYKILAVFFGGLIMILFVLFIQQLYEKLLLKPVQQKA